MARAATVAKIAVSRAKKRGGVHATKVFSARKDRGRRLPVVGGPERMAAIAAKRNQERVEAGSLELLNALSTSPRK